MDEDNLLEIQHLNVSFKDADGEWRKVVDDVGYTVKRGRALGVVGESGSGKSVSSLAVMGLLPPPSHCKVEGSALFMGQELIGMDDKQMQDVRGKHISMIFQEPMTSLNPVKRCGEQVVEMMRLHEQVDYEEARRRTLALFEEVMLPRPESIFDSYPHQISGGQKQRVMIAMALACNPELVIADEPTTALDVTVQKTILQLLRDLQQKRKLSIIFITHDLGVIAQIADDIVVMYKGKIVERGDAATVLHNPSEPYTRGLIACRPPLEGRPKRLPTVADFMSGRDVAASDEDVRETIDRTQPPLLSVNGLDVTYVLERNVWGKPRKKLNAVDGVSFDVYKGETLGLVGESGCGKTTLGRAILRLVDSASGSIVFKGKRLDTMKPGEVRRMRPSMQIIFQDPYSSLNPRMTVGQTIIEPLENYRMYGNATQRREKVLELMEKVGLDPDWYDRYPHEFSGGQRQRICIARALILNPELVICDESVSALDVSVQAQVLNLLNELKEEFGYTYIFISHDLSVVHFLSDRILVMQNGKMVELEDSDKLFKNPQNPYTQRLLDAIPRM